MEGSFLPLFCSYIHHQQRLCRFVFALSLIISHALSAVSGTSSSSVCERTT